jgi:hypothetical protein
MTLVANSVRGGGSLSGYDCFTIDEGLTTREDTDPRCRLVVADPVDPIHDLHVFRNTPPGDECARERHIAEIDRQRIIDYASRAGWCRVPPIGTAIRIEPLSHLVQSSASSA